MAHHQVEDLVIISSFADPALYFKTTEHGTRIGLSGPYVDDSLHCGNEQFLNLTDKILDKF